MNDQEKSHLGAGGFPHETKAGDQTNLSPQVITNCATPQDLVEALRPITDRVRSDVTAVKRTGVKGSRWTDQPLTDERMRVHVTSSTGPWRGACPIKEGESTTRIALLDLDSHKGETLWDDMMRIAIEVKAAAAMWGINVIPFRSSGGKGIHLFALWDEPQDAFSVRESLGEVLGIAGFYDGTMGVSHQQIEIFPKQNEIRPGEFGNQFILPLADQSAPLDLVRGVVMERDAVIGMPMLASAPVIVRAPDAREDAGEAYGEPDTDAKVLEAALMIPNDGSHPEMGYQWWFPMVCAIHEATGGLGYDIAVAFSERNKERFDLEEFRDRIWPFIKPRERAATRAKLYGEANKWRVTKTAEEAFPIVEETPPEPGAVAVQDLPGFLGRKKDGTIPPSLNNLLMACRNEAFSGRRIAHDSFRDEVMVSFDGGRNWRPFNDADYTRLRSHFTRNDFDEITQEAIKSAVHLVAEENRFDSAVLWLESLPRWDGVSRVADFFHRRFGTADTPYSRAVSLYTWTALAGRVLVPGCQADMVPIVHGPQGAQKTSVVKAMSPSTDHFVEVDLNGRDTDLSRKMRGKLVAEMGELRGMRAKEIEGIKAFVTRTHEEWVPKYKEFGSTFPRRLIFIGTTNAEEFLVDDTGNRRWLPISVETTCDPVGAADDVLQLWAEAAELFRAKGVHWQDAKSLAEKEHGKFERIDVKAEALQQWIDGPDISGAAISARPYLTTSMVIREAWRIDIGRSTRGDEMDAGAALRKLGYVKTRLSTDRRPWVYLKPGE